MKKIRVVISLIGLLCSTALSIAIVVAWYVNVSVVNEMEFNILQIDSLVTLYQANDSNFNGVPNRDETNAGKYYNSEIENTETGEKGVYVDYASAYYKEYYSFNYHDQKYALSADSSANLLNDIVINDALPSKIYTFKYEVINYSGLENDLEFTLDESTVDINILKYFDCRLGIISNSEDTSNPGNISFFDWIDLVDYDGSSINLNPTENIIKVPDKTNGGNGRLDLWFQVRVKADCKAKIENFKLPMNRISLTVQNNN